MMDWDFKKLKEAGLTLLMFLLVCWVVIMVVTKHTETLDDMQDDFKTFSAGVVKDHQEFTEEAQEIRRENTEQHHIMMQQQTELLLQQREVTHALGRLNGYRHE